MTDNRTTELKSCIKCIDDMTNDLLEISDVLEEHQVNVRLENGRYLNPVSAIRSKVDVIWDEVQLMAAMLGSGTCDAIFDKDYYVGINGVCESLKCSSCGNPLSAKFRHCPWCGARIRKAVER